MGDVCPSCKGSGVTWDGRARWACRRCGGDGRDKYVEPADVARAPRVLWPKQKGAPR